MQDEPLTKLHPNHVKAMRAVTVLNVLPIVVGALALEIAGILPTGVFLVPAVLVAVFLALLIPIKRYKARGYHMGEDRLRVVRGIMFRHDSVVPFGRVQHLDVEQGPIARLYGISTLVLHTAGTHNASVRLSGLGHAEAMKMREIIRAHVRAETM